MRLGKLVMRGVSVLLGAVVLVLTLLTSPALAHEGKQGGYAKGWEWGESYTWSLTLNASTTKELYEQIDKYAGLGGGFAAVGPYLSESLGAAAPPLAAAAGLSAMGAFALKWCSDDGEHGVTIHGWSYVNYALRDPDTLPNPYEVGWDAYEEALKHNPGVRMYVPLLCSSQD